MSGTEGSGPDRGWSPEEACDRAVARFSALCALPEAEVALDEGCLLAASAVDPAADVASGLARLDALAAGVAEPTVASLVHHLFVTEGFSGNRSAYYDPVNSLLHRVLDRRVGIPITLSIVAMEVGRRIGVPLVGVGLPGHFLVRSTQSDVVVRSTGADLFLDAFDGGRTLDLDAVRALVANLTGPDQPFDDGWLAPVDRFATLARVLANLKQIYRSLGQRSALATVLRLRAVVPGVAPSERRELADALAGVGRFDEAAAELDSLASRIEGTPQAEELNVRARRLRARLN